MTPFLGWIAHAIVVWWAYGPLGRLLSLGSLAICASPFLLASTGLAGDEGSASARTLCWALLAAWTVPAVLVGMARSRV